MTTEIDTSPVTDLLVAACEQHDGSEAMKYAQAALSAAQALSVLVNVGLIAKEPESK